MVSPADTSNWETREVSRYVRRALADSLDDPPRVVVEGALRRALAEHLGDLPPFIVADALELADHEPEEREWLDRFRGLMLQEAEVYVQRWIEDMRYDAAVDKALETLKVVKRYAPSPSPPPPPPVLRRVCGARWRSTPGRRRA